MEIVANILLETFNESQLHPNHVTCCEKSFDLVHHPPKNAINNNNVTSPPGNGTPTGLPPNMPAPSAAAVAAASVPQMVQPQPTILISTTIDQPPTATIAPPHLVATSQIQAIQAAAAAAAVATAEIQATPLAPQVPVVVVEARNTTAQHSTQTEHQPMTMAAAASSHVPATYTPAVVHQIVHQGVNAPLVDGVAGIGGGLPPSLNHNQQQRHQQELQAQQHVQQLQNQQQETTAVAESQQLHYAPHVATQATPTSGTAGGPLQQHQHHHHHHHHHHHLQQQQQQQGTGEIHSVQQQPPPAHLQQVQHHQQHQLPSVTANEMVNQSEAVNLHQQPPVTLIEVAKQQPQPPTS